MERSWGKYAPTPPPTWSPDSPRFTNTNLYRIPHGRTVSRTSTILRQQQHQTREMDTSRSPEDATGSPQTRVAARLARKRATDRRAQRAARERRQNYIDSLLHQIESLSGMPHNQVHELFESNERLRAENELLRNRTAGLLGDGSEHGGSAGSGATVATDDGTIVTSPVQALLLQHHAHDSRESAATICMCCRGAYVANRPLTTARCRQS